MLFEHNRWAIFYLMHNEPWLELSDHIPIFIDNKETSEGSETNIDLADTFHINILTNAFLFNK